MAFDLVDIIFPTGAWGKSFAKVGNFTLQKTYGIDLNEESVEITKLSLWLKTANKEKELTSLDHNILCGNSIINDNKVSPKAFKWEQRLSKIINNGGFDIVLGNPPWGAELQNNEKEFIYNNYTTIEYQIDTYVVFTEKSYSLLASAGYFGFIFPSTWLYQTYFNKLRRYLIENTSFKDIRLFKYNVFENVTAETCIFSYKKEKAIENKINISIINSINDFDKVELKSIKQTSLDSAISSSFNIYYGEDYIEIIKKIYKNSVLVNDIAEITVGIKPYQVNKGKPKQTREIVENRIFDSTEKINDFYKNYITGSEIFKYYIDVSNKYIKYGTWLAEPRQSLDFNQDKIVIRQTSDRIIGAFDRKSLFNLNNVHNLVIKNNKIDCRTILAILNSKLFDFVYKYLVPEAGRTFAEVKTVNIEKLPIIIPSENTSQKISSQVEKIENKYKEYYSYKKNLQELLLHEYNFKLTKKDFTNFKKFNSERLLSEIKKQKININITKKEELIDWFFKKCSLIIKLEEEINNLSKTIDNEIFKLYGLSNEDIEIIESKEYIQKFSK